MWNSLYLVRRDEYVAVAQHSGSTTVLDNYTQQNGLLFNDLKDELRRNLGKRGARGICFDSIL